MLFLEAQDKGGVEMNTNTLIRLKCPHCGEYVHALVKESRVLNGGIFRRRVCEACGVIIVTNESIERFYNKRNYQKTL